MIPLGSLTETQRRLFGRLADGLPCPREELQKLLNDELSVGSNLASHVHHLRKKLARYGLSVMAVGQNGQTCYRLVRFVSRGE